MVSERYKRQSPSRTACSDASSASDLVFALASVTVFLGVLFVTLEVWSPVNLLVVALLAFQTLITMKLSQSDDRIGKALVRVRTGVRKTLDIH